MSASTAAQARSTRSSGRTGPGNRHCSGSRAASSTRTRAPSRSAGEPPARLSCRGPQARPRHCVPDLLARPRPVCGREPLSRRARRPADRRTGAWRSGRRETRRVRARRPADGAAGSLSLAERQLLEVVKALLAKPKVLLLDEPTTALGPEDVERLHALVFEQSRAGVGVVYVSHRLPEVLGIADRITVLRDGVCQGTFDAAGMSEESLVALMIGRPLQLAFPERHDQEAQREVLPRRLGPAGRPIRADRPRGREGRDPRDRGRRGQRPGAVPPRARRCRARDRERRLRRQRARHEVAARPAPRRRRAAERRPSQESLFPVLSVRANTTIQVLRRLGRLGFLNRRRERRTVDDLVRRLSIRMASIEQPVQSLSGGNQQKVSLTRPFLRGRRQGHPRRRADPGRRCRRAVRHLRRAAREGEGGRRHHRQVERSARARRALRPRRRDVARTDRRRDPRRRARRTPDRRGDRGLARRCARVCD